MAKGRAYFIDNKRSDVLNVAHELMYSNPTLAHELKMDYDQMTANEAGGYLYTAKRTGPKFRQSDGQLIDGSDRITFTRNKFNDLSLVEKIDVLQDNIAGYDGLIETLNLSDKELSNKLRPHNPNKLIYDDLKQIFYRNVDAKTGIYSGPGQVGSPSRNGGKPFSKYEAIDNAVQFLTEPVLDRLLGTKVSFAQQGHVLDAKNNKSLARDLNNMRAQQAGPNQKDGASAKGLVNLTPKENLLRGKQNDIDMLGELIDERLQQNISPEESLRLVNIMRSLNNKSRINSGEFNRYAGDVFTGMARVNSPGDTINSPVTTVTSLGM